jgi:hypothetical protein
MMLHTIALAQATGQIHGPICIAMPWQGKRPDDRLQETESAFVNMRLAYRVHLHEAKGSASVGCSGMLQHG